MLLDAATVAELREQWGEEARQEARGEHFFHTQNAHRSFGHQLLSLARTIARIIESFAPGDPEAWEPPQLARLDHAMRRYSIAIEPWARAVSRRMLAEVSRRDLTAWQRYTQGMAASLRREIAKTPTGAIMERLLTRQVALITSLPTEASQRVHEKSLEGLNLGTRFPEREAEVRAMLAEAHPDATLSWLKTRARLIARTETARSASVLTQARAKQIKAEQYIWKTAKDWKVRPSHRRLEGSVHDWDNPPLSDLPDYHSHPGQIFNCRCIALPIIP